MLVRLVRVFSTALGLVLVALGLSGCKAKDFRNVDLTTQAAVAKPVYDDRDIQAEFKKKPNLPKPFRVAVYFNNLIYQSLHERSWQWTEGDREFLDGVAKEWRQDHLVSQAYEIPRSLVTDQSLKGLRLAAAKTQADALLIVGGAGDVERSANQWAVSYVLIVPALFVRGSEARALFVTEASLYDVRNEYLYLAAHSEGRAQETYAPASGKTDHDLLEAAKTDALAKLATQLKDLVRGTN